MPPIQTVLLVMQSGPGRDLLAKAMEPLGVKVLAEGTMAGALDGLRHQRPNLVVAGLELSDAKGPAIVEKLRGDVRGSLVPLLIAMDKPDTRTMIALYALGVDAVTPTDEPAEVFAARIGMMLRRSRKLGAALIDAESLDRHKIAFLEAWAKSPAEPLKPTASIASPTGYTYERARAHFGCAPGAELEHLEDLASRMCLERKFFDRIRLCPQCGHHAVNIREVSPKTKSPDLSRVDALRHRACGHTGPVREFARGLDYVCPKCQETMRHAGIDYDRPGSMCIDNETGEAFMTPELSGVCLACGFVSSPEQMVRRTIYTYTLGPRGLLAAETGRLSEVSLDAVLTDFDLRIYTPAFFQRQLSVEIERARRYRHPLGLAIVRLDQYEGFLEQYGEASRDYLAQVAETLKAHTRASDFIARHERDAIVMLFPETDLEGSRTACEKLRNAVLSLKAPRPDSQLTISCGVSAYPDAVEDPERLIASATECFASAHSIGGNVVVVAPVAPKASA